MMFFSVYIGLMRVIRRIGCLCLLTLIPLTCFALNPSLLKDGDLVFHASLSSQSLAIQHATKSNYSHVGLIVFRNKKPFVLEAIATVRYTPLDAWIKRGQNRNVVVKRLKQHEKYFTVQNVLLFRKHANEYVGKPYDLAFEWSDERIYCSELVWKVYHKVFDLQIGRLQQLKDFNLGSPIVQLKLRERYGKHIPLDQKVISPQAIFDSPLLFTVTEEAKLPRLSLFSLEFLK